MNAKSSKVSVIIPIYNLKGYLQHSINSILVQSHKNTEIILVDDGSTDGSSDLCDELAKKNTGIKVIHKANAGVSAARNTGLENANGDFIMFLDGDDIIAPNAIEVLLDDYYSTPKCVYAGFSYSRISKYNHDFPDCLSEHKIYSNSRILYGLMGHGYENIGVCGKIFPAERVKEKRFIEGKGANEDKFFLFQYLNDNNGNISERDDELYGYYVRTGSATQSKYSGRMLDTTFFSKRILDTIKAERPELTEAAEYNDIVTRLGVLKSIIRSHMYKKEYYTFSKVKKEMFKDYDDKKMSFFGRYKLEIWMLRLCDYLYIISVYLFDLMKKKHI